MEEYLFIVFCVLAFLLGACFGSFANVLIYRIPKNESIIKGASHCVKCQKPIKWYDNIPILSYIILGGKCRFCKQKINPRYVIVETLCAFLWLGLAFLSKRTGYAYVILAMLFTVCCVVIAFIDFEHKYIPDRFNIIILLIGVAACFSDTYVSVKSRLIGMGFSAVFFGGTYFISKYGFKREGLGFGDVKFMTVVGLFLGIKADFFAVLISTVVAAVVLGVISYKERKNDGNKESKEYPFAPFLGAASIIAAYIGEIVANAYLSIF